MNYDDIQNEREAERKEVSRKFASGQSFIEHAMEKSAFDLDALRQARIIVHAGGKDIVLDDLAQSAK